MKTLLESLKTATNLYKDKINNQIFTYFTENDPTKTFKYLEWMCKIYYEKHNKKYNKETANDIVRSITEFDRLVEKNKIRNKDINSYKTLVDLNKMLILVANVKTKKEKNIENMKGAEKILDNEYYKIYFITTEEASCKLGFGTKWCISAKNNNLFDEYYTRNSRFYFVINKKLPETDPDYKIAVSLLIDNKDFIIEGNKIKINPSDIGMETYNASDEIIELDDYIKKYKNLDKKIFQYKFMNAYNILKKEEKYYLIYDENIIYTGKNISRYSKEIFILDGKNVVIRNGKITNVKVNKELIPILEAIKNSKKIYYIENQPSGWGGFILNNLFTIIAEDFGGDEESWDDDDDEYYFAKTFYWGDRSKNDIIYNNENYSFHYLLTIWNQYQEPTGEGTEISEEVNQKRVFAFINMLKNKKEISKLKIYTLNINEDKILNFFKLINEEINYKKMSSFDDL